MVADFNLFGSHGQGTHTGAGHLLALDAPPFHCAHCPLLMASYGLPGGLRTVALMVECRITWTPTLRRSKTIVSF
jgi:hypothetical protein